MRCSTSYIPRRLDVTLILLAARPMIGPARVTVTSCVTYKLDVNAYSGQLTAATIELASNYYKYRVIQISRV